MDCPRRPPCEAGIVVLHRCDASCAGGEHRGRTWRQECPHCGPWYVQLNRGGVARVLAAMWQGESPRAAPETRAPRYHCRPREEAPSAAEALHRLEAVEARIIALTEPLGTAELYCTDALSAAVGDDS